MGWLRRLWAKWRNRGWTPVMGSDWNYTDERANRVIGYQRGHELRISDRKTWLEILP